MDKRPRINFMRAGSRLETLGTNRIPHHERVWAYEHRITGWVGSAYYVDGVPMMTV